MDGLMDCAASSTPYPDRLATVIRRRHAWAAMEWNDTASVHLPGTCLAYELVADVLAKLTDSRKFVYVELPSLDFIDSIGLNDKHYRSILEQPPRFTHIRVSSKNTTRS